MKINHQIMKRNRRLQQEMVKIMRSISKVNNRKMMTIMQIKSSRIMDKMTEYVATKRKSPHHKEKTRKTMETKKKRRIKLRSRAIMTL